MTRHGYMGKILLVDLTKETFEEVVLAENIYKQYIGGYGLGVRILYEKMKPNVDPLGPDNWIGFAAGVLTGTAVPSGGRFVVVGKSPLTGGWGDANCGGSFGPALKSAGYDGIFITGKSPKPVYLLLTDDVKEIRDASHLWGMDSIETEESLKNELAINGVKVACIGQAGEKLSKIAAVMHDHGRAAGRSGLGAVMGSKNLKAVAVKGSLKVSTADEAAVKRVVAELRDELKNDPKPIAKRFGETGTPSNYAGLVASQDAPIKNWKGIAEKDYTFDQASKMSGVSFDKYKVRKYACAQCGIGCGAFVERKDSASNQTVTSHRPEYETVAAFGSMCLVDDIEAVIKANELCNCYGFDTISAGATVAFAMECFEEGILTEKDTGGIPLIWGNAEAVLQLLELMSKREGIGDILADGVKAAAAKIGKGAEKLAMHAGGQELPMHDPRLAPGLAGIYELSPTPGRHTQTGLGMAQGGLGDAALAGYQLGNLVEEKYNYDFERYGISQAVYSHWYQFMNATGLCQIALMCYKHYPLVEIVCAVTGWKDFEFAEAIKAGERIDTLRHCFNLRQGIGADDFKLPGRVLGSPPLEAGPLARVTIDRDKLKKAYLEHVDWDSASMIPSNKKLSLLGLTDLVGNLGA